MKKKNIQFSLFLIILIFSNVVLGGGEQTNFAFGLKVGLNRIEGDLNSPLFKPFTYGSIRYNLFEYFAIGFESGYSVTGSNKDNNRLQPKFQSMIIPFEGQVIFSFLPLQKINPYVILGGGGFYWEYIEDGQVPRHYYKLVENGSTEDVEIDYGKSMKGYDSFIKSGGGIEILLNRNGNFYFDLGFTFRYSLTDMFDGVYGGDENDGLLDVYGGVTYYFRSTTRGDRDNDGIPDELDLKVEIREDPDGFMDHDGKPEAIPPSINTSTSDSDSLIADTEPPVVIHAPIHRVEAGKNITIKADIYEQRLKTTSIIYRPIGFDGWKVGALRSKGGSSYEGVIPGRFVTKQGLEYCVIAVDEATNGVGYCGLPKLPVRVEVLSHPKTWRIISGAAALVGWGGSGYLILRKQK